MPNRTDVDDYETGDLVLNRNQVLDDALQDVMAWLNIDIFLRGYLILLKEQKETLFDGLE